MMGGYNVLHLCGVDVVDGGGSEIASVRGKWRGALQGALVLWERQGGVALAVVFVLVFSVLFIRKHDSFHTYALDFGKFDQAIWNTLHGRFLFSTLSNRSILANHFSPLMALLAPLFLVFPDARVLLVVQVVCLAVAGLVLGAIVHLDRPRLTTWFLLAFYLNPALHDVALTEFRRVTLAVPFVALALYALRTGRRWLMAVALAAALLYKENIALLVFMFGGYLLLRERDWRWGISLMVVGMVWAVGVTFWLIPHLDSHPKAAMYPQVTTYLGVGGSSYKEVLSNLDPLAPVRRMVDRAALRALWRVLLPLGVVIPFLAPDWAAMCVPLFAYMLASNAPSLHKLERWYMALPLPVLFAAVGVALGRISERRGRWMVGGLVLASVVGYALFSPAPLGGHYDPALYRVTDHHRMAARVVAAVPDGARVAAQDPYVPHLAHREHIYLYPWIAIGEENVEYIVLDRQVSSYPMYPHQLAERIDELVANTAYKVAMEGDGIYLFRRGGEAWPAFLVGRVAGDAMRLERVEVAPKGEDGFYHPLAREPLELRPGQEVRVSLYWEAVAEPRAERTVSVRIADATGRLVAIYDNIPGQGKKPTSWWKQGWRIRDVYYLSVAPDAQPGMGWLDVMVYDSLSMDTVPFDGEPTVRVCRVRLIAR